MPISVLVHPFYRKFFTYYWQGRFYEYQRLPNRYDQAPFLFTKLLKPPFAMLQWRQGLLSVVYLDDSYLQGDSYSGCLRNITATTGLLTALGFKINHEKAVLTPTQTIKFLGFLLDYVQMVISLTAERKVRILAVCKSLRANNLLKIRGFCFRNWLLSGCIAWRLTWCSPLSGSGESQKCCTRLTQRKV